jgi:hypothetical protein
MVTTVPLASVSDAFFWTHISLPFAASLCSVRKVGREFTWHSLANIYFLILAFFYFSKIIENKLLIYFIWRFQARTRLLSFHETDSRSPSLLPEVAVSRDMLWILLGRG